MAKKQTTKKIKKNTVKEVSLAQLTSLRKWNLWIALLFSVQAFAIAIIGTAGAVPVTINYLAANPLASEAAGEQILALATRHLFDVRLAWIVAVFLLLFALVYLAVATVFRKRYETRLQQGMNDFRWVGLGLGGGVMLVTMALMSGLQDLTGLFMIFVLVLGGSVAVLCAEEIAHREQQKKALLSHIVCAIGTVSLVVPWIVLAKIVGAAALYDGVTRGYMWGIYSSMGVLFVIGFVLTHFRIKRRGRLADTVYSERAYMLLWLVAASALAWQIFAGALQP